MKRLSKGDEAALINRLSSVFDDTLDLIGRDSESYAYLLDIFSKALITTVDDPAEAFVGIAQALSDPSAIRAARRLGFRRDGDGENQ